jgi:hypothetical protein
MTMSYNFKITSKGGELSVTSTGGTAPDGEFFVSGHEDTAIRSINIGRIGPDGLAVVQAAGGGAPTPAAPQE